MLANSAEIDPSIELRRESSATLTHQIYSETLMCAKTRQAAARCRIVADRTILVARTLRVTPLPLSTNSLSKPGSTATVGDDRGTIAGMLPVTDKEL